MVIGNSLSNISNGGLAAIKDNDIYFVNVYRGEDLYRMVGKIYHQVTDDKVKGLNIIGETIYYTTILGELRSVDLFGGNRKKILDGPVESAVATQDYIFYINVLDNYSIYRYDLKNGEIKKISSDICDKINVDKDYVYYIRCSSDLDWYGLGDICRVDTDGNNSELVSNQITNNMVLDGEYLYFTLQEFGYKLNRLNVSTGKMERIIDSMVGSFNVNNGYIYYSNISDENKMYRVEINGANPVKISDDMSENINIVGEYIYFANTTYGYPYRLYRMNLDGTGKQMI